MKSLIKAVENSVKFLFRNSFTINITCLLIPSKKLRQNLRAKKSKKTATVSTVRIMELQGKKQGLLLRKEAIETVCLGSSHGAYGFYPPLFSDTSYNLCSTSQDLYYSSELYNYCTKQLPNLKNIILFYSVFSPGFDLQKTNEKATCQLFNENFDIPYKYDEFSKTEIKKVAASDIDFENGFFNQRPFMKGDNVQERAKTHLRENRREVKQTIFLEKIVEESIKNSYTLTIVTSPVTEEYRENMPDQEELFKDICSLQKKYNFEIVDFYSDSSFTSDDFGDFDHLNFTGAKKLTNKLKSLLKAKKSKMI